MEHETYLSFYATWKFPQPYLWNVKHISVLWYMEVSATLSMKREIYRNNFVHGAWKCFILIYRTCSIVLIHIATKFLLLQPRTRGLWNTVSSCWCNNFCDTLYHARIMSLCQSY